MMRCSKSLKTAAFRRMPPCAYRLLRAFKAASAPTTTANFWNASQKSGWRAGTVGGDIRIYTEITSFRFSPRPSPRRKYSHTEMRVVVVAVAGSTLCGFDHLSQRPYRFRDSRRLRWRSSQRLVNAAKVVPSEIQREHRAEICSLFRERIRKAGESTNLHSHREVLPFDVRRADFAENWVPPLWDRYGVHDFGRRVVALAIGGSGINLHQLRVVNARSQAVMDGFDVRPETVRCELESACRCLVQFFNEGVGISRRSPSEMPRENQLVVAFDSDEAIGVAAFRVARQVPLFFAADEPPQFVALYFGYADRADSILKESFALFAKQNEQGKNRSVVNSRDALDCIYRASLDKQFEHADRGVQRSSHGAERRGVFCGESLAALMAAEPLESVPVFPESLALTTAIVTGHFGLPFLRSKPIMFCRSAFAANSAIADLPCRQPQTDGRAFLFLPPKPVRPTSVGTLNLALGVESLQNRIYECQWILNPCEWVAPAFERVSDFNGAHRFPCELPDCDTNKVRPCDFGLYLLAQRIQKSSFRCVQLGNFDIQAIALLRFHGFSCLDRSKGFLEVVRHDNNNYTQTEHSCQA